MFLFILSSHIQIFTQLGPRLVLDNRKYVFGKQKKLFRRGGWIILDICVDSFQGESLWRPNQKGI